MTQQEIDRVKKLIDMPIADLRRYAFDGGDFEPSIAEQKARFQRWTKGQLIAKILEFETQEIRE
jgi:hypothetical protein